MNSALWPRARVGGWLARRRKAPNPAKPSGSGGSFPVVPVAGAVAVLLVLAGAFMLRSRRRPAPAAVPVVAQPPGFAAGFVQTQSPPTQPSDNGVAAAVAAHATPVMVATEPGRHHFCPSCGQAIAGGAFCSNCGNRIDH